MSLEPVYFDEARRGLTVGAKVAVLGYGSQGHAQALNLRDSGLNVSVANVDDKYRARAERDGFDVLDFSAAVEDADFTLLLVPDHAQPDVYRLIESKLKPGSMLIVSHGFSIHFESVVPTNLVDVAILAPRMPGKPIRESYLAGSGIPAFYGVIADVSGNCEKLLLSIADNIGYTKKGVLPTSLKEETEVDLFIEQFLLPHLIHLLECSFEFLVDKGVSEEVAHMEVYSSGELADLLKIAAKEGLHEAWRNHASPTCRFGIYEGLERCQSQVSFEEEMQRTLTDIRSGQFTKRLSDEYSNGLPQLTGFDEKNARKQIAQTQSKINEIFG